MSQEVEKLHRAFMVDEHELAELWVPNIPSLQLFNYFSFVHCVTRMKGGHRGPGVSNLSIREGKTLTVPDMWHIKFGQSLTHCTPCQLWTNS